MFKEKKKRKKNFVSFYKLNFSQNFYNLSKTYHFDNCGIKGTYNPKKLIKIGFWKKTANFLHLIQLCM